MDTLIIGNQTLEITRAAILSAVKNGKALSAARLDFVSLDDAWNILNAKRRAIMNSMVGQKPLAIREIARRVGRDVRAVHSDVSMLHRAGVIDRTEDGKMLLPYKVVKFDFILEPHAGPAEVAAYANISKVNKRTAEPRVLSEGLVGSDDENDL